jgi:hypothetical protein
MLFVKLYLIRYFIEINLGASPKIREMSNELMILFRTGHYDLLDMNGITAYDGRYGRVVRHG